VIFNSNVLAFVIYGDFKLGMCGLCPRFARPKLLPDLNRGRTGTSSQSCLISQKQAIAPGEKWSASGRAIGMTSARCLAARGHLHQSDSIGTDGEQISFTNGAVFINLAAVIRKAIVGEGNQGCQKTGGRCGQLGLILLHHGGQRAPRFL